MVIAEGPLLAEGSLPAKGYLLAEGSDKTVSIDDYQDFKKTLQRGQREIEQNERLLHHHDIHTLIPEVFQEGANRVADGKGETEKTRATKGAKESSEGRPLKEAVSQSADIYSNGEVESEKAKQDQISAAPGTREQKIANTHPVQPRDADRQHSAKGAAKKESSNSNLLRGKDRIELKPRVSYPKANTVKYGIKMGTQIQVKLVGGATSVQLGLVRFELLEAVTGEEDVLPVGTLIFGKPFANNGSDRIQVRITKGITPDGDEFSLRGWIRGSDGMDGLLGKVVSDGQLVARSLNETVNAAGRAALASVADDSIALTSMKSGLSNAQSEQSEESDRVFGRPEFIVQASEQLAMLEIERTF
jgi:hypothetical protein